jgi:hypothetical protein
MTPQKLASDEWARHAEFLPIDANTPGLTLAVLKSSRSGIKDSRRHLARYLLENGAHGVETDDIREKTNDCTSRR